MYLTRVKSAVVLFKKSLTKKVMYPVEKVEACISRKDESASYLALLYFVYFALLTFLSISMKIHQYLWKIH